MPKRKPTTTSQQCIQAILDEYDQQCAFLEEFKLITERLICDLLKSNSLRVHSVTARVKEKQSISDKIKKSGQYTYQHLDDIDDICGHRIITYFPDEVDAVAEIIQNEFDIDYSSSVDKRAILDPDRFGYLSLHYIAKLPERRLRLPEYSRFNKCKTEIQIRSILQHTWAEIEHDLGYKSKLAVPSNIRRRFSQLAGLLELADDTFVQIRDSLDDYESKISDRISKTPESVQIDQASLLNFVENSKLLNEIDSEISSKYGGPILKTVSDNFVIALLQRLNYIDIHNIAELSEYLSTRKEDICTLGATFLNKCYESLKRSQRGTTRGIGILYLFYLLLLERSQNIAIFKQQLISAGYKPDDVDKYSKIFFDIYKPK